MKRVMVRYKVKPDRADENAEYIRKVFEELAATKPAGLRYASFKLEDGVSFVHLAFIDTADGTNPLSETSAFKDFQATLKDRIEEPPVAVTLDEVGDFRLFGN